MWDCDSFRRFESMYFTDDFFTDFEEEMQEEIEDAFTDISDQGPKELIEDYQILSSEQNAKYRWRSGNVWVAG